MRDYRVEGNEAFSKKDYSTAVHLYSLALQEKCYDTLAQVKCLNNRALCYFNMDKMEECLNDSLKALQLDPENVKAKYRQAAALFHLDRLLESFEVLKEVLRTSENARHDESITGLYQKVTESLRQKAEEQKSTSNKVRLCFDALKSETEEKRKTALRNLAVLSKESDGCKVLDANNVIPILKQFLDEHDTCKNDCFYILSNLALNSKERSSKIIDVLPIRYICDTIAAAPNFESANTCGNLLDNITFAYTELEEKRKVHKPINERFKFDADENKYIDELFRSAGELIGEPSCTADGRDSLMTIIMKYCDMENSCGWSSRFIPFGIPKVLRIGASVEGLPKCLPLNDKTKVHASCLLTAVYDDLCSDRHRDEYRTTCETFIRHLIEEDSEESLARAISCLTVILQGPFDPGNSIVGSLGMIDKIMRLATSGKEKYERIALDAILLSSSKTDKAMGLLREGYNILKELYISTDEKVQIMALLGLCKLSSSKGADYSKKTVTEESLKKLESTCCRFLLSDKDIDIRIHAADGIAYLSLDGDVKERIVANKAVMHSLFDLVKQDPSPTTCFTVASILFNLSNAEVMKKPDKEMIKLAKYSKHHVPTDHPKDKKSFYEARRKRLVALGAASTLVLIAKEKSETCQTMVAKIYLALSEERENRGVLVSAGAGKALIALSKQGAAAIPASHALARIAISGNPAICFPGQKCLEVIKPLNQLLHPDRSGMENYEALLAFTNLAVVSPSVRKKINDEAFQSIEHYMFEDHALLRRAATEVMCNLCADEQVFPRFTAENDRVRLLVLLCGEEDIELNRAAAGALAQLSFHEIVCKKIINTKNFAELLKPIVTCSDIDLQYRGFFILRNLINNGKESSLAIVETELMDVIFAMSRLDDKERKKTIDLASEIVRKCLENEYIKASYKALE